MIDDTTIQSDLGFWARNLWLITVIQSVFYVILVGTLAIAVLPATGKLEVELDGALIYFPPMAYIPHTLSIIALLQILAIFYRKEKFEEMEINAFISKLEFSKEFSKPVRILRKISIGMVYTITSISWIMGIGTMPTGDGLLFSPMNMITLSSILSFLIIWFSYGIKKENMQIIAYLTLLLCFNTFMHVWSILLIGDNPVLPFVLSYQLLAIVLSFSRWSYFKFT